MLCHSVVPVANACCTKTAGFNSSTSARQLHTTSYESENKGLPGGLEQAKMGTDSCKLVALPPLQHDVGATDPDSGQCDIVDSMPYDVHDWH
jgi:hypothetical protein